MKCMIRVFPIDLSALKEAFAELGSRATDRSPVDVKLKKVEDATTLDDKKVEEKKPDSEQTEDEKQEQGHEPSGPRIRCPLCGWAPRARDRWMCSCKHEWNTFDTGGVCPACLYQWMITMCLACHRWSPHSDWYTHREE